MANLTVLIIMISFGNAAAITIRVGKYMGFAQIDAAKRAAKCGAIIGAMVSLIGFILLFSLRSHIGSLWTDNSEINDLISGQLVYVVIIQQFAVSLYQNLGGVYRGIGYQKISALFVILSYYGLVLPILCVLLFGLHLKGDTKWGTSVIWSSLAMGNCIAALLLLYHLGCYLDWNTAMNRVLQRVRQRENDRKTKYGSTDGREGG